MTKDQKDTNVVNYSSMTQTELWDHFGGEMKRGNVSYVIRFLSKENFTTSQISKMLGKRYQHIRNVLTQPLKK